MTKLGFYLASSEGYGMEEPRRGFTIRRLRGDHRDDYLLARIDPPMIGQSFGRQRDLDDTPCRSVAVSYPELASLRPRGAASRTDRGTRRLHDDELVSIAGAEIYQTEEAARAKAI